jgi:hypothetical protein
MSVAGLRLLHYGFLRCCKCHHLLYLCHGMDSIDLEKGRQPWDMDEKVCFLGGHGFAGGCSMHAGKVYWTYSGKATALTCGDTHARLQQRLKC